MKKSSYIKLVLVSGIVAAGIHAAPASEEATAKPIGGGETGLSHARSVQGANHRSFSDRKEARDSTHAMGTGGGGHTIVRGGFGRMYFHTGG